MSHYATEVCKCPIIFKETSAERIAQDVASRAEKHSPSAGTCFLAHHLTGLFDKGWIPGRTEGNPAREGCRTDFGIRPSRPVTARDHRDVQTVESGKTHVAAIAEADLLFKGHLFNQ